MPIKDKVARRAYMRDYMRRRRHPESNTLFPESGESAGNASIESNPSGLGYAIFMLAVGVLGFLFIASGGSNASAPRAPIIANRSMR